VDGRNLATVDRWFIPLFIGFQPSMVVQDFFHPQYHNFLVNSFALMIKHPVPTIAHILPHFPRKTSVNDPMVGG